MSRSRLFEKEVDLVAAFGAEVERLNGLKHYDHAIWRIYHETAGWDLLLVDEAASVQVGIEAKLALNPKVLEQALPSHWSDRTGPDYRAVLVPREGLQNHLRVIAKHLGITVLTIGGVERGRNWKRFWNMMPHSLPNENQAWFVGDDWPCWFPEERCKLPDYVPDVTGGRAAPIQLTEWKIKAIKLLILLERRGAVSTADMRALRISPRRWTDHYYGFLAGTPGGWVRCAATPDLKAQHPENWAQIEADFETWSKGLPGVLPMERG